MDEVQYVIPVHTGRHQERMAFGLETFLTTTFRSHPTAVQCQFATYDKMEGTSSREPGLKGAVLLTSGVWWWMKKG